MCASGEKPGQGSVAFAQRRFRTCFLLAARLANQAVMTPCDRTCENASPTSWETTVATPTSMEVATAVPTSYEAPESESGSPMESAQGKDASTGVGKGPEDGRICTKSCTMGFCGLVCENKTMSETGAQTTVKPVETESVEPSKSQGSELSSATTTWSKASAETTYSSVMSTASASRSMAMSSSGTVPTKSFKMVSTLRPINTQSDRPTVDGMQSNQAPNCFESAVILVVGMATITTAFLVVISWN